MKKNSVVIDWEYSGPADGFFGTGADLYEHSLVWVFGLLGAGLLLWHWMSSLVNWEWWQLALASLLALDVLGGVAANALNSCKRFYHSELKAGETGFTALAKNHLVFSLLHIHPLLIGLLFGNLNWGYGVVWYAALVLSTVLVLAAPLYLRRPLALGLVMTAILLNGYFIVPVHGFEWLMPAMFLKIVYGHNVREEPYRKESI